MAIQTVNLAVPNGDTPRSANTKINANFSDPTHAASRLVGTEAGNVMQVGAFGLGSVNLAVQPSNQKTATGFSTIHGLAPDDTSKMPPYQMAINLPWSDYTQGGQIVLGTSSSPRLGFRTWNNAESKWNDYIEVRTTINTTRDANGFLKSASPVIDMYDNKIGLNQDAEQQGGITFDKLGVGDYLVKGSLGFAQEGWYIETPKDANGNVLVAVVYEQLANNDLSIKTYAKKFDDETGDIIPNLLKPRDIPTGRFISLRLHELPKEPLVMPTETQPEV